MKTLGLSTAQKLLEGLLAYLWFPPQETPAIRLFHLKSLNASRGPAVGAVVRTTEFGQVGYRQFAPFSLRLRDFGRRFPGIIERSNEMGFGPALLQSPERDVCTGEVGAGADLLLVGAYGGICVEELADFLTGLFFVDLMDDDL